MKVENRKWKMVVYFAPMDMRITFSILILFSLNVAAQVNSPDSTHNSSNVFAYVEQMPEFPGGQAEMMKFISSNISYPPDAKAAGIEGRVVAHFIVNEDGSISDIAIIKGISSSCDSEVIRVISAMPKWKPGLQNGKTVKVYFNLPVTFRLDEPDLTKPGITSPSYLMGDDSLHAFVQKNLQYPKEAKKKKIAGTVVLSFDVDATGRSQNAKIYKALGAGCDEEALRILNLIQWNPGTKEGKPVLMPYYMEVEFRLPPK